MKKFNFWEPNIINQSEEIANHHNMISHNFNMQLSQQILPFGSKEITFRTTQMNSSQNQGLKNSGMVFSNRNENSGEQQFFLPKQRIIQEDKNNDEKNPDLDDIDSLFEQDSLYR